MFFFVFIVYRVELDRVKRWLIGADVIQKGMCAPDSTVHSLSLLNKPKGSCQKRSLHVLILPSYVYPCNILCMIIISGSSEKGLTCTIVTMILYLECSHLITCSNNQSHHFADKTFCLCLHQCERLLRRTRACNPNVNISHD